MKARWFLALACMVAMAGCTGPVPELTVSMTPQLGLAPYQATITCTAPRGLFTFTLPGQTIGPQPEGTITTTIDRAGWSAVVTWTDGETVLARTITADISNSLPQIAGVIVNGKKDRWYLTRMERTLLQAVVHHSGEYLVTGFSVSGALSSIPYSVFYPPYERDVCHAYWNGWIFEDACIVYPVYASVEEQPLPYSPTGLDAGYPTSYRYTNTIVDRLPDYDADDGSSVQIPEQEGTITVSVQDEFGRTVTKSFSIPIRAYVLQRDKEKPKPDSEA